MGNEQFKIDEQERRLLKEKKASRPRCLNPGSEENVSCNGYFNSDGIHEE